MPGGSKKGGGLEVGSAYKMKNSALHMGAKHGSPIQKNYGKGMPLTEGGKKSIMASDANPEFKAAIANSPVDMHSPVKKYKSAAQRKAVHASKAESGAKYASPAKEGTFKEKKRAVKLGEKYGNDPGYQAYLDKTMGGKTKIKGSKTETTKNI